MTKHSLYERAIRVWQMETAIRNAELYHFDTIGFTKLDYLEVADLWAKDLHHENIQYIADTYLKFYRYSPMISGLIHFVMEKKTIQEQNEFLNVLRLAWFPTSVKGGGGA